MTTTQQAMDKLKDTLDEELYEFVTKRMVGDFNVDVLHVVMNMDYGRGPTDEEAQLYVLCQMFALKMFWKAFEAEQKYNFNGAWREPDWQEDFVKKFSYHVLKGDPRDVALFCAFADHHGWSTDWPKNLEDAAHNMVQLIEQDKKAERLEDLPDGRVWLDAIDRLSQETEYARYTRKHAQDAPIQEQAEEGLKGLE